MFDRVVRRSALAAPAAPRAFRVCPNGARVSQWRRGSRPSFLLLSGGGARTISSSGCFPPVGYLTRKCFAQARAARLGLGRPPPPPDPPRCFCLHSSCLMVACCPEWCPECVFATDENIAMRVRVARSLCEGCPATCDPVL